MITSILRAALVIPFASLVLCAGEPQPAQSEPEEMRTYLRELDEAWKTIEPQLFLKDGGNAHIGEWVRCSGSPISLRPPVTIKLASGTTVRLTKLQGADRQALGSFHRPPSVVTVHGPILAVDRATRTVTIKAVSTMFDQ
jgi:hypothetical protein